MADEKLENGNETRPARLRQAALFVLFSIVLLIPKTLALRRRRKLWNALRILTALAGGVLAGTATADGLGDAALGVGILLGVLLMLLALVTPSVKTAASVDETARALGALVVLNGGLFSAGTQKPAPVRLYLTPERLHVLDQRHRMLLEIPLAGIATVRVERGKSEKERTLRIEWRAGKAEFSYQGFFADHLAEVARSTLESRLPSRLRVLR